MITWLASKIQPWVNAKPIIEMTVFFSENLKETRKSHQHEHDPRQVWDESFAKEPL